MSFVEKIRQTSEAVVSETRGGTGKWSFLVPNAILALIFLVPIVSLLFTDVPALTAKGGFLFFSGWVILILWLFTRFKEGVVVLPKSIVLAAVGGVTFSYLVSALFSGSISVSFMGAGTEGGTFMAFFIFALIAYLVSSNFQSHKRVYSLYLTLISTGFVVAIYEVARLIFNESMSGLPANLIGSFNDFALFFGLIAVISLATVELVALGKKMKYVFVASLVTALIMLVLANFTIAWVGVGVFSLLIFVYAVSFGGRSNVSVSGRSIPALPLFVVIFSILLVMSSGPVGNAIQKGFGISNVEVRPSWIGTSEVIKDVLNDNLILGTGPNQFSQAWLLHKPEGINSTIMWNVDFHSGVGVIPSSVVETGVLGGVAWASFLLLLLFRGGQLIYRARPNADKVSRYVMVSSFLGSLYAWTFILFYVPNIYNILLAFIMTGLFVATLVQAGIVKTWKLSILDDPRINFISVLFMILMLIVSLASGFTILQRSSAAGYHIDHAIALNQAGDISLAKEKINKAINLYNNDLYYRDLSALYLVELGSVLSSTESEETLKLQFQELSRLVISSAISAKDINPNNYLNWLALSRAYSSLIQFGLPAGYENAAAANEQALVHNPKNPAIHLAQARLELLNGSSEKAKDQIGKALALKGNYTEAIFLLAQIQADEGNIVEAIQSTEVATLVAPNDFGVYFQLGFLKYQNEDYGGAVSAFERAIELNPVYANAMYFLGLSYYELGQTDRAVVVFKKVSDLNSDNLEVKNIIKNLGEGRGPFEDNTPRKTPVVPPAEREELPVGGAE